MKVVRLIGGLGNQMFQYALFLALKEAFPEEKIYIDASLFMSYKIHNGIELERVFGIKIEQAPISVLRRLTWYSSNYTLVRIFRKILPIKKTECREALDYTLNESVLKNHGDRIFCGYWQNHLYFDIAEKKIRAVFCFDAPEDKRNIDLIRELATNSKSVSIHVRRGDYLKAPNYAGLCNLDYYRNAIEIAIDQLKNPSFYIFSDDINYCREHINPLLRDNSVVYIDWNKGLDCFRDMQLMSLCKLNIIANSSFSWWAAYLNSNNNKQVFAPLKWTNTIVNCKFQMSDWILL